MEINPFKTVVSNAGIIKSPTERKVEIEYQPTDSISIQADRMEPQDKIPSLKQISMTVKENEARKAEKKPALPQNVGKSSNIPAENLSERKPGEKDTFVFVLNSSGETNMCKSMISALKNDNFDVKVIHFRKISKEILMAQGLLEEKDFIDGTNSLYLPRLGSIFDHEIDIKRINKIVSTPHHVYCRFVFSKAKELGIPTVAVVDLGIPGAEKLRYRQTFYKSVENADKIIVPNDSVIKQFDAANSFLKSKGKQEIDTSRVAIGGNPGFEAFHQLVEMNRKKADQIRNELKIGKDDLVFSFSSQPTDNNGIILETLGKSLTILSEKYPEKKIHIMLVPHPRDLKKVGIKNLFGTETSISIDEKINILKNETKDSKNITVHEMPKYSMEKAASVSCVVLTEGSTTAYECARADIPSIFVRTQEQGEGGAFPGFNRIPTFKEPGKLADGLDEMIKNPPKELSEDLSKVVDSNIEPAMKILLEKVK